MKALTQEQKQELIDVIKGDKLPDELDWNPGFDPMDEHKLLSALLEDTLDSHSAEDVETALHLSHNSFNNGGEFGFQTVPILTKLLTQDWHYSHEELARILQGLRDVRSTEALYTAALVEHSYLNYDETFGLARKCTWALADIGNKDEYQKLQLLGANSNVQIAGYAQKRIDSWQKEQDRKAFHFLP